MPGKNRAILPKKYIFYPIKLIFQVEPIVILIGLVTFFNVKQPHFINMKYSLSYMQKCMQKWRKSKFCEIFEFVFFELTGEKIRQRAWRPAWIRLVHHGYELYGKKVKKKSSISHIEKLDVRCKNLSLEIELEIRVKVNILAYNYFIWTKLSGKTSPIVMVKSINSLQQTN